MEQNSICASSFVQTFDFPSVVSFFLVQTKTLEDLFAYKYLKLFCLVSETFLGLLKANFLLEIRPILVSFECDRLILGFKLLQSFLLQSNFRGLHYLQKHLK